MRNSLLSDITWAFKMINGCKKEDSNFKLSFQSSIGFLVVYVANQSPREAWFLHLNLVYQWKYISRNLHFVVYDVRQQWTCGERFIDEKAATHFLCGYIIPMCLRSRFNRGHCSCEMRFYKLALFITKVAGACTCNSNFWYKARKLNWKQSILSIPNVFDVRSVHVYKK